MSALGAGASTTAKNLAVFIDADNLNDATALDHVLLTVRALADRVVYRRAYGRPESLKSIHAVLWRHGVRPVANLIVDKTTTDSALVIDAVEAVCTNDIDIVAICSGDADFVPLATWLREKGCRVLCYSLANKIFANSESFYDDVVLLDVVEPESPPDSEAKVAVPAQASPRQATVASAEPLPNQVKPTQPAAPSAVVAVPSVKKILAVLPELRTKEPLHLSKAARKLRDAGVLGEKSSSTPLFRRFPAQFELLPPEQPNTVKYRG
ncbi:NYN domain-containing protein [Variovorax rhizosphaerae]|uniref:NYN domain-containing protein n=1 Tax=Variovorax rhizosphaerae TaxID=1836200 RepID=A0ABU8WIN8_9BURK